MIKISLLFLITSFNVHAMNFRISIWEKIDCALGELCLPKSIDEVKNVSIPEPTENSFSRVSVPFKDFEVILTFAKRIDNGGYYSFQTDIIDKEKTPISVCSRFEAIETMEKAPVGACGAYIPSESRMIGVSVLLP
ncbi:MAG: hypothetical protein K9K67_07660 [Bacteriovoracaceae bacterium]|nr:hypothetical protein [Bacteriovoracaceae bacterium]